VWLAAVALLLPASLAGCGDDDDDGNENQDRARPVAGTFVGTLKGSEELVAVVAAPVVEGQKRREVSAFVCDARRLCAWYSGASAGNRAVARAAEGGAKTEIELSRQGATGSVELPEGNTGQYTAREATATAGLYDLTVAAGGKVTGASAAGVGLTGKVTLPPPGSGRLKLADGTRLKFEVTETTAADGAQLRAGQLRLIVLPDGEVRGAGKSRGEGGSEFFVHSAPKE
jgi:hypothetical protein